MSNEAGRNSLKMHILSILYELSFLLVSFLQNMLKILQQKGENKINQFLLSSISDACLLPFYTASILTISIEFSCQLLTHSRRTDILL